MNKLASVFISACNRYNLNDRNKLAALTIGNALAYSLALPTSPVDNPGTFFVNSHNKTINETLSGVNESVVIPVDFVKEFVRKVWLARYNICFKPTSSEATELLTCILSCSNSVYGGELLSSLKENQTAIYLIVGELTAVLEKAE
jgi:hypothetical protein